MLNPKKLSRRRARSRDELHDYWRHPGRANRPEAYLEGSKRFLVELVGEYLTESQSVLGIRCNVWRNVAQLYGAGYRQLRGRLRNLTPSPLIGTSCIPQ